MQNTTIIRGGEKTKTEAPPANGTLHLNLETVASNGSRLTPLPEVITGGIQRNADPGAQAENTAFAEVVRATEIGVKMISVVGRLTNSGRVRRNGEGHE